ncbi:unnamed protein product [Amaranthus hypochondriacus]
MSLYSLFHIFLIVTSPLYYLPSSRAQNNEIDLISLLKIKAKITHDPLNVLTSWNQTIHHCKWYGVTCSPPNQRVTILDLSSSKLSGNISPYLSNLTFLRELYLQNNTFSGMIPLEISHLHRLEILHLFNNSIQGEIPLNISSCYSLINLHLSSNNLVGPIPPTIGSLSNLQSLSLAKLNLIGNIPSSFGNLSSLSKLTLAYNNLNGMIPKNLGNLNLTKLLLGANRLSGLVPRSIFNMSSLTLLALSQNDLEGTLPSNLGNTLPNLRMFYVSSNRFIGLIPLSISNSSNLEVLEMEENRFHGAVPSLHKLVNLTDLILYNNSLGYDQINDLNFISSLGNATNLQSIQISRNNFHGVIPNSICNFSSLIMIYLSDNHFFGEIPKCIENLSNLQHFVAKNNEFSGVIPQGIGKLKNLYLLFLGSNKLSGFIPSTIGNLSMLSTLHLSNNNLEGNIISTIGNCKSLEDVYLAYNNLSGRIPSQLFSLPSLSIGLNLTGNRLSGSLPEEIGQMRNLNGLDLSNNMLSGEIPSTFGSCVSLEFVYMGNNNFEGNIPNSLQALKGLVELNLSFNKFYGEIPKFLASFKLQILDLSHNNLVGEVPIGGVFNNESGLSIIGNNKICGGSSMLKLPNCDIENMNKRKRLIMVVCGFLGLVLLVILLVLLYLFNQKKKAKQPIVPSLSKKFPNLSYKTLLEATNGFSSMNLIGYGAFGIVYKGVLNREDDEDSKLIVAIKIFDLEHCGAFKSFMAECEVLRSIKHRNIVKIITACSSIDYQGNDFKALVYEYMVNGSLDDWLHPIDPMDKNGGMNDMPSSLNLCKRVDIAVDVAFALDYLHHHCYGPIVHGDLKPSNVLLDDQMVAHVSDFGMAKFLSEACTTSSTIGVKGTIGYVPPEYGLGNEVSTSGDVYSYGIFLLEMFTGKRPTHQIFEGNLTIHDFVAQSFPNQVANVIDHALLEDIYSVDNDSVLLDVLISILKIALSCSIENPKQRLDMGCVARKLSSIKMIFLTRLKQLRVPRNDTSPLLSTRR